MKIITITLVLISSFLSLKHGWDAFQPANAEQAKMMTDLGITKFMVPFVGALSIMIGLMLFFPQTFFIGNLLNAITIVLIMAFSLNAGNYKVALLMRELVCKEPHFLFVEERLNQLSIRF